MPVCHKRKLSFVHIPRTGGVSICRTLRLDDLKHETASYHRKHYPDYHLFYVYRPYRERLISAWNNFYINPKPEFGDQRKFEGGREEFIGELLSRRRDPVDLLEFRNEYFIDCAVDSVVVFESLQEGIDRLLEHLGHEKVELLRLNATPDKIKANG